MKPDNRSILHIGNILNNGYLHCKYLRKKGVLADCLNVDYNHCQGQPEWAEVSFDQPVEQWGPDWSKYDLAGFKRPDWFFDVKRKDLHALADAINSSMRLEVPFALTTLPLESETPEVRRNIKIIPGTETNSFRRLLMVRRWIGNAMQTLKIKKVVLHALFTITFSVRFFLTWKVVQTHRKLMREFKEAFPLMTPKFGKAEFFDLYNKAEQYKPLLKQYNLIQAYALDPVIVLLAAPDIPFICYEHGTMREFPFEDSVRGNLYALCLKKAEKVIITNSDCILSANRLRLTNAVFIPHLVDDDLITPSKTPLRAQLCVETGCDLIILCPARHHWKNFPLGLEHSLSKRNDIMIKALGRIFTERPDLKILIVLFEWGQECELSKQLIRECGFEDKVRWEPIRSKPVMQHFYNAADIVLDQFNDGIGTFGAVVPEAMACKKPVVLNFKKELHTWCYPVLPPIIGASNVEEVEREVSRLIDDEAYRLQMGELGRKWYLEHHSSDVVIGRIMDVYQQVWKNQGWDWPI